MLILGIDDAGRGPVIGPMVLAGCLLNEEAEKELKNMNIKNNYIKVENPSSEYNALRSWMIPSLLKILSENKHNELPQNLFEIGTIVKEDYSEAERLGIVLCSEKANFTEIKQIMEYLFGSLDIKYEINEAI